MTNAELIRRVLDDYKMFAKNVSYKDSLDLAMQYFVNNPNTHNNWDVLDENVKEINVKLAECAINEIATGK